MKNRFNQERGMPIAAKLEKTLLDAANGTFDSTKGLAREVEMYSKDMDMQHLLVQLQL